MYCTTCGHAEGETHDLVVSTGVTPPHEFVFETPKPKKDWFGGNPTPPKPKTPKTPSPATVGHFFHGMMTVATGGIWAPIWAGSAMTVKKRRHRQLLEQNERLIGALEQK